MRITKGYEDVVEITQGETESTKITVRTASVQDTMELMDLIKRLSKGKIWFTFKVKLGVGDNEE